jgi:hypothetical protein
MALVGYCVQDHFIQDYFIYQCKYKKNKNKFNVIDKRYF